MRGQYPRATVRHGRRLQPPTGRPHSSENSPASPTSSCRLAGLDPVPTVGRGHGRGFTVHANPRCHPAILYTSSQSPDAIPSPLTVIPSEAEGPEPSVPQPLSSSPTPFSVFPDSDRGPTRKLPLPWERAGACPALDAGVRAPPRLPAPRCGAGTHGQGSTRSTSTTPNRQATFSHLGAPAAAGMVDSRGKRPLQNSLSRGRGQG